VLTISGQDKIKNKLMADTGKIIGFPESQLPA